MAILSQWGETLMYSSLIGGAIAVLATLVWLAAIEPIRAAASMIALLPAVPAAIWLSRSSYYAKSKQYFTAVVKLSLTAFSFGLVLAFPLAVIAEGFAALAVKQITRDDASSASGLVLGGDLSSAFAAVAVSVIAGGIIEEPAKLAAALLARWVLLPPVEEGTSTVAPSGRNAQQNKAAAKRREGELLGRKQLLYLPLSRPHALISAAFGFAIGEALLFTAVEAAQSGWRAAAWTAAVRVIAGVPLHVACSAFIGLAWLRADAVRSVMLVVFRSRQQMGEVTQIVTKKHAIAYREAALEASGNGGWASWISCTCLWEAGGCCGTCNGMEQPSPPVAEEMPEWTREGDVVMAPELAAAVTGVGGQEEENLRRNRGGCSDNDGSSASCCCCCQSRIPDHVPWHLYTEYVEPSPWPLTGWAALLHVTFNAANLMGPVLAAHLGLREDQENGDPSWGESLFVLCVSACLSLMIVLLAVVEEQAFDRQFKRWDAFQYALIAAVTQQKEPGAVPDASPSADSHGTKSAAKPQQGVGKGARVGAEAGGGARRRGRGSDGGNGQREESEEEAGDKEANVMHTLAPAGELRHSSAGASSGQQGRSHVQLLSGSSHVANVGSWREEDSDDDQSDI